MFTARTLVHSADGGCRRYKNFVIHVDTSMGEYFFDIYQLKSTDFQESTQDWRDALLEKLEENVGSFYDTEGEAIVAAANIIEAEYM